MILSAHHAQITIPPDSEGVAKDFYCGLLGLREVPKPQSLARRGGFWLQLNDFQVHVGVESGVERQRSKAHIAYLVDDLELWRIQRSAIQGLLLLRAGLVQVEAPPNPQLRPALRSRHTGYRSVQSVFGG